MWTANPILTVVYCSSKCIKINWINPKTRVFLEKRNGYMLPYIISWPLCHMYQTTNVLADYSPITAMKERDRPKPMISAFLKQLLFLNFHAYTTLWIFTSLSDFNSFFFFPAEGPGVKPTVFIDHCQQGRFWIDFYMSNISFSNNCWHFTKVSRGAVCPNSYQLPNMLQ